jgi:hypothetical protein
MPVNVLIARRPPSIPLIPRHRYSAHSTPNPNCVLPPNVVVVEGSKFDPVKDDHDHDHDQGGAERGSQVDPAA